MARTVVDIKPDGGGDYTSIGAAWNAIKALSSWGDGYDFRLFPGLTGCGSATIAGATFLPTSSVNLRIYAAEGFGVNGGGWLSTDLVATLGNLTIREPFCHIGYLPGVGEGFQWDGGSSHPLIADVSTAAVNASGLVVDSCYLLNTNPDQESGICARVWMASDTHSPVDFTFRNNIFRVTGNLDDFSQNNAMLSLGSVTGSDAAAMTFNLYNNLMFSDAPNSGAGRKIHQAFKFFNKTVNGTIAGDIRNNICVGEDFTEAYEEGASGTYTVSGDYNAAQDTSLVTKLGGSNNITNIVASNEFADPDNGIFRLKSVAQAINAGDSTLSVDMLQAIRDGDHHSMGPLEFISSSALTADFWS